MTIRDPKADINARKAFFKILSCPLLSLTLVDTISNSKLMDTLVAKKEVYWKNLQRLEICDKVSLEDVISLLELTPFLVKLHITLHEWTAFGLYERFFRCASGAVGRGRAGGKPLISNLKFNLAYVTRSGCGVKFCFT